MREEFVVLEHCFPVQYCIDWRSHFVVHCEDVPAKVARDWFENAGIEPPLYVIGLVTGIAADDCRFDIGGQVMP